MKSINPTASRAPARLQPGDRLPDIISRVEVAPGVWRRCTITDRELVATPACHPSEVREYTKAGKPIPMSVHVAGRIVR